jgi:HAD superfamily hydrolase (TIGR01484 family)
MSLPIQLISTDFDGTFFAEFENPPVPHELQQLIARLQAAGAKWVINTGRDMSSLMESLGRAHLSIRPDFLVLVEREIYIHEGAKYAGLEEWNRDCHAAQAELFARIRNDIPRLFDWVNERFDATVYADAYSPFCLIADNNGDADAIHDYLNEYCRTVPNLTVVRNDVYARFSHAGYSKGTALAEIARQLGVHRDQVLAAGDHLNDLPMLSRSHARWLIAPSNAIPVVKEAVRRQDGFVADEPHGYGVVRGLEFFLGTMQFSQANLIQKTDD